MEKLILDKFGALEFLDTLIWYDGPMMFSMESDTGDIFLLCAVDEAETSTLYTLSKLDKDTYDKIKKSELPYRSGFIGDFVSKDTQGFVKWSEENEWEVIEYPLSNDIPEKWLPKNNSQESYI